MANVCFFPQLYKLYFTDELPQFKQRIIISNSFLESAVNSRIQKNDVFLRNSSCSSLRRISLTKDASLEIPVKNYSA
jgi:hypothetical protein